MRICLFYDHACISFRILLWNDIEPRFSEISKWRSPLFPAYPFSCFPVLFTPTIHFHPPIALELNPIETPFLRSLDHFFLSFLFFFFFFFSFLRWRMATAQWCRLSLVAFPRENYPFIPILCAFRPDLQFLLGVEKRFGNGFFFSFLRCYGARNFKSILRCWASSRFHVQYAVALQ